MIYPQSFEHKIGFPSVREAVSKKCVTPMGRSEVPVMEFTTDYREVTRRLRTTAEMLSIVSGDSDVPLQGMDDVTRMLRLIQVEGSFLPAADLLKVRKALASVRELYSFLSVNDDTGSAQEPVYRYPYLWGVVREMDTFAMQERRIDSVIDELGNVRDNASSELAGIRRSIQSMAGRVNSVMRKVISSAVEQGIVEADTAATVRDGRLVIPVLPMNKRRINGIVHDESASGKTVFIEPAEVVEVNNRIRELQMEEHREIVRILTEVASALRPLIPSMIRSCRILGEIDFIHAKARFALEVGGLLPSVSPHPELEWYHACHPVLLTTLRRQNKEIVPLDINLTPENRILVISGPNAGGKSVCLKTVGMIQYMMQCGLLPVLYENSRMGIFDDIFVDIGDDQSIEDDLSTYSSHLKSMKYFLQYGSKKSLMLIDEFGGGTEPQIGGALAQAILRELNDNGMWGVITTHYQNLKHFAEDTSGLINGSMLYDRHMMKPLFKLSIGSPGSSFALEIARKIGLPSHVISDAENIVGSDYVNLDKYLLDIARDRKYWENKRLSIKQKEKKLEQTLLRYENDAEELRGRRREILNEAKNEAKRILEGSNAAIEKAIRDIRTAQAEKERTLDARRALKEESRSLLESDGKMDKALRKAPKPKPPRRPIESASETSDRSDSMPMAVGDVVKLEGQGTPGRIIELSGDNATVTFGMMKTTVKTSRLKRTIAKIDSGASKSASLIGVDTSNAQRTRQLEFKPDIDVRGMRVDEAVQAITYFIDDAIQFNIGRVRILHGTGTGALRQYIRRYLDTVPGVSTYRDEHVQFGGAGITVVDLK